MHGKTMRADGSGAECDPARPSARHPWHARAPWALMLALPWATPARAAEHLSFLDPQGPIAAAARDHFILVTAVLLIFVALPVFIGTRGTKKPRWPSTIARIDDQAPASVRISPSPSKLATSAPKVKAGNNADWQIVSQNSVSRSSRFSGGLPPRIAALSAPIEMPANQLGSMPASWRP